MYLTSDVCNMGNIPQPNRYISVTVLHYKYLLIKKFMHCAVITSFSNELADMYIDDMV